MKKLKNYLPTLFYILFFLSLFEVDKELGRVLVGEKTDSIYGLMSFVSGIFDVTSIVLLTLATGLVFLFLKNKVAAYQVLIAGAVNGLLNYTLKLIFKRPRPDYRIIQEVGHSFPSGHSSQAACFFVSIYFGLLIYDKVKSRKNIFALLFGLCASLVATSRLYFGVHYLTDIMAGLGLGWMVGIFVNKALKKRMNHRT